MKIFPAIDLYGGKAVRLYKGDYAQMTVYSENPVEVALDFKAAGAEWIHLVDLEGARDGDTPNLEVVRKIVSESGLKAEVGGGLDHSPLPPAATPHRPDNRTPGNPAHRTAVISPSGLRWPDHRVKLS